MMQKMENEYTQQEVLRNIKVFEKQEEDLLQQRKDINKALLHARKQIEYWRELDLSQLKIF